MKCLTCGFGPDTPSESGNTGICPACGLLRPETSFSRPTGSEVEVEPEMRDFLFGLVRILKPRLVVETGCYRGASTQALGEAVATNGIGLVATCDVILEHVKDTSERCRALPVCAYLSRGIDLPDLPRADLLFLDSDYRARTDELVAAKDGAIVVIHDTAVSYDSEIQPYGVWIESLGGIAFDTGRGFGIMRRRHRR